MMMNYLQRSYAAFLLSALALIACATCLPALERIIVAPAKTHFITAESGQTFSPWGFNYDHDSDGRLLEDYWHAEWSTVVEDFREMKQLGANVVRIHLQVSRFMDSPTAPNVRELKRLAQLLEVAEAVGLHLDITGLGCYHKADMPDWYPTLSEKERWAVQAAFWTAVARTCKASPAVFCYGLMNEPVLPGANKTETEWLLGELGGKHFVQRISLDLAGRTRPEVARQWVQHLTTAIRHQDEHRLITVGVIPWALTFPGAKPIFYAEPIAPYLDFVSVHFYPERGQIDRALDALKTYELGKPLVVEEIFPLKCDLDQLADFIKRAEHVDGWIGFYWGTPPDAFPQQNPTISQAIQKGWLEFFQKGRSGI